MDLEEQLAARYEPALTLGVQTSPGLRVAVGDGQEVEVVHVLADAFQTILFCRVHGGPGHDAPHFGPHVAALDPPELARPGPGSGTRWQGFEVLHLAAVLPFRRAITLGFTPALPGDTPPDVLRARFQRRREEAPTNLLTVPVDPRRAAAHARTGRGGVTSRSDDLRVDVLSFVAGITATQVAVVTDPPQHEFDPRSQRLARLPHDDALPAGAPSELWRDAAHSQQPAPPRTVAQVASGPTDRAARPPRRALPFDPWRAAALPGGEQLSQQGGSWGWGQPAILTFDPPPPGSTGLRLSLDGAYRWEPVVAWAEVQAPTPGPDVPLNGASLAFPGGRLDLVAWEPGATHHALVTRPGQWAGAGNWPSWLPELRLVVGDASRGLVCSPCDDGTFVFSITAEDVSGPTIRLATRAVGRRLPPVTLDLPFDPL